MLPCAACGVSINIASECGQPELFAVGGADYC